MTLCPVAIAIGCKKCPIVRMCPVKGLIGDYKPKKSARSTPRRGTAEKNAADKKVLYEDLKEDVRKLA